MSVFSDTIAQYFAAIRNTNVNMWVALFAENGVSHDPAGVAKYSGHEELRKFFLGINQAFAKISFVEEDVYAGKNEFAVKWNAQGTSHNGVTVSFSGIDTFKMDENGKILELKGYWDLDSVMNKLK